MPEDEKKTSIQKRADRKAATGSSKSTPSQTKPLVRKVTRSSSIIGRINTVRGNTFSPSFPVTVADGDTTITALGRTDDGSDESIHSSKFAESAVLKEIGEMSQIKAANLQVGLKNAEAAQSFSFSCT